MNVHGSQVTTYTFTSFHTFTFRSLSGYIDRCKHISTVCVYGFGQRELSFILGHRIFLVFVHYFKNQQRNFFFAQYKSEFKFRKIIFRVLLFDECYIPVDKKNINIEKKKFKIQEIGFRYYIHYIFNHIRSDCMSLFEVREFFLSKNQIICIKYVCVVCLQSGQCDLSTFNVIMIVQPSILLFSFEKS